VADSVLEVAVVAFEVRVRDLEERLDIAVKALARIGAINVHERHLPPAAARDLAVSIAGDAFAEIRALVKRGPE